MGHHKWCWKCRAWPQEDVCAEVRAANSQVGGKMSWCSWGAGRKSADWHKCSWSRIFCHGAASSFPSAQFAVVFPSTVYPVVAIWSHGWPLWPPEACWRQRGLLEQGAAAGQDKASPAPAQPGSHLEDRQAAETRGCLVRCSAWHSGSQTLACECFKNKQIELDLFLISVRLRSRSASWNEAHFFNGILKMIAPL